MNFHISKIIIHLDVYLDPIHWPAPSWLVSSIGRALHRYRRGHGFKSRTGLNFFQVLFTTTRFSSVLSCEDLLISSLHRSANIWIFIYLKSEYYVVHIFPLGHHEFALVGFTLFRRSLRSVSSSFFFRSSSDLNEMSLYTSTFCAVWGQWKFSQPKSMQKFLHVCDSPGT